MKKLDVSQTLKSFTGNPLQSEDGTSADLRTVLLTYIAAAHRMSIKDSDVPLLYSAGGKIGNAEQYAELTQPEYDAVKRLVDSGKIRGQRGDEPLFPIVTSEQVKELVDCAGNSNDEDG